MDEHELIESLQRTPQGHDLQKSPRCPGDAQLAAWLDGDLRQEPSSLVEAHVADCEFCIEQVARILRSLDDSVPGDLPAALRQRAELLAARWMKPPHQRKPWAPGLAAAAALVLAVGLMATQLYGPGSQSEQDVVRQTRYVDGEGLKPRLLVPAEGSVIQPSGQEFRWTEVPGSLFYDVRLVNADGDLLLRERVEETHWLVPAHVQLQSGEEYFVRVDAYLSDAQYLSSEHLVFRVGGRN